MTTMTVASTERVMAVISNALNSNDIGWPVVLVCRPEQIAVGGERVQQAAAVGGDENQRGPEAETIERRRMGRQGAIERKVEHSRHDKGDHGEKQHGRRVGGGGAMKFLD